MKTGFFPALYGTCSGLMIFERLKEQSFWRAVLHLLLMSILSSIVMTIGVYPGLQRLVNGATQTISENCGSIKIASSGVLPEKSPEKDRSFIIAGPISITYLAPGGTSLPKDFRQDCYTGIIWSERRLGLWMMQSRNAFQYIPLSDPVLAVSAQSCSSAEELYKLFKKSPELNLSGSETLTPEKLRAVGEVFLLLGWAGWVLRITVLEVVIYIAMFAGVFLLMNLGRPRRLKVRDVVVLAVYAGFPAMLIGSLAEALKLPYLDFNVIYSLGMMIYLILAMNRLERNRQEREWRGGSARDDG